MDSKQGQSGHVVVIDAHCGSLAPGSKLEEPQELSEECLTVLAQGAYDWAAVGPCSPVGLAHHACCETHASLNKGTTSTCRI